MPMNPQLLDQLAEVTQLRQPRTAQKASKGVVVKRGHEILANTDYPENWDDFVGQVGAKRMLTAHIESARSRGARMDHILLASGLHGVGKTTLAHMIAAEFGAGFVTLSGAVTLDEAQRVFRSLSDGDVIFWDEFHTAVFGGKAKVEWLLPYMTDGVLMTARGAVQVPDVTIIAATTDAGKLPQTVLSRFPVRPRLMPYNADEAREIANLMGYSIEVDGRTLTSYINTFIPHGMRRVAQAASHNPRAIKSILLMARDAFLSGEHDGELHLDLDEHAWPATLPEGSSRDLIGVALDWAGYTYDGLDHEAADMLQVLLLAKDHTASIDTIAAQLNEPGPLRHAEQLLLQKGLLTITGRGRKLTELGAERALALALGKTDDPTTYTEEN